MEPEQLLHSIIGQIEEIPIGKELFFCNSVLRRIPKHLSLTPLDSLMASIPEGCFKYRVVDAQGLVRVKRMEQDGSKWYLFNFEWNDYQYKEGKYVKR